MPRSSCCVPPRLITACNFGLSARILHNRFEVIATNEGKQRQREHRVSRAWARRNWCAHAVDGHKGLDALGALAKHFLTHVANFGAACASMTQITSADMRMNSLANAGRDQMQ
eukprot:4761906-Pleurochrysis_carterae.AAC.13